MLMYPKMIFLGYFKRRFWSLSKQFASFTLATGSDVVDIFKVFSLNVWLLVLLRSEQCWFNSCLSCCVSLPVLLVASIQ